MEARKSGSRRVVFVFLISLIAAVAIALTAGAGRGRAVLPCGGGCSGEQVSCTHTWSGSYLGDAVAIDGGWGCEGNMASWSLSIKGGKCYGPGEPLGNYYTAEVYHSTGSDIWYDSHLLGANGMFCSDGTEYVSPMDPGGNHPQDVTLFVSAGCGCLTPTPYTVTITIYKP